MTSRSARPESVAATEELTDNAGDRSRLLRRALYLSLISIVLSGVLGTIAVVVGLSTGSLSLIGFGFDAAIDGIASIALAWRFATEIDTRLRTDNLERTAEIIVGCVLLVIAAYLGFNAVLALINGSHPEVTQSAWLSRCSRCWRCRCWHSQSTEPRSRCTAARCEPTASSPLSLPHSPRSASLGSRSPNSWA